MEDLARGKDEYNFWPLIRIYIYMTKVNTYVQYIYFLLIWKSEEHSFFFICLVSVSVDRQIKITIFNFDLF